MRDFRAKAGDAYIAYSRALTLDDDKGYGDALWKGVDLYDRAGDLQRVISALELFVGRAAGRFAAPGCAAAARPGVSGGGAVRQGDRAFQRNQFRYPKSLAASKSAVPLAQAYIAKGPGALRARPRSVLLSVVENNPLITPEAEEFKQALFELAQLYYRTSRYEEAVRGSKS